MEEYRKQLEHLPEQARISSSDTTDVDEISKQLITKLDILEKLVTAGTWLQFLLGTESSSALKNTVNEIKHGCKEVQKKYNQLMQLSVVEPKTLSILNETHDKYLDLVARFNNLYDVYGSVVSENQAIVSSRTWRFANKLKSVARKTGLLHFAKYLITVRKFGLIEGTKRVIHKLTPSKAQNDIIPHVDEWLQNSNACLADEEIIRAIVFRKDKYTKILDDGVVNDTIDSLNRQLNAKKYKGIVVYPHAVHWEPMQRPQHLLREFAKKGYLCFFCESSVWETPFLEVEDNLYIVNDEGIILPFLQDKHPIVLITYSLQAVFCEFLPQKTIWFDVLDRLDFFALSGNMSREIYDNLLKTAHTVSYSAKSLQTFVQGRSDTILLPNAVNLSDFRNEHEQNNIDNMLQKILSNGKPVIGYYGAVEEWFDYEAVTYLADHLECEIVIIGHVGIDTALLKRKNIHLLGPKPYHELQRFSRSFKIGLIPFIVNDLTNAVSPVKFFEYCALGISTVSSGITEMLAFEGKAVHIYRNHSELVMACNAILETEKAGEIRQEAMTIAEENSWEKRACEIEEKLLSSLLTIQALANTNHFGTVAVETVTFFDFKGSCYYSGGAERYLIDLHTVCKEMGIQLQIYQYAEIPWVRFYNDIQVIGMHANDVDPNLYSTSAIKAMARHFNRIVGEQASLCIYSPFFILDEKPKSKVIGISHGVAWDTEHVQHDGFSFWKTNSIRIDACAAADCMISVDTNTANWFQTINYELGRKITYIPNYVDNVEFSPRNGFDSVAEKVIITYPRRLYAPRGLYIVLEVLDDILEKWPNVEFHFVGKGFESDTKHVENKVRKWKGRVKWYSCAPDKMHEVYKQSDISLIPTMYSEGTSLSCLEALSSGNAVIATRIGGLTDLILNNYNGLLIEPNAESLRAAIFSLLEDPMRMVQIKRVAVASAKAFSKDNWKEKWKKMIREMLPDSALLTPYHPPQICYIALHHMDLTNAVLVAVVKRLLNENWTVFIASKEAGISFERLQFVSLEEELYFDPSLYLMDTDGSLEQFYERS